MKKHFTTFLFLITGLISFSQTGNVGIGNTTPVAKLDVAGDLALREGTAIAVSGASPAVSISLHATNAENSFYRITGSPTGTMTLSSIANGVDGQIIALVNATSIKLKITNNNTANGILTAGALTQVISPNGSVTLQFSTTAARWFVTNAAGSTLVDWTKATTADEPAISTDDQYVVGNVGIGDFSASSPGFKLHVKGNIYPEGFYVVQNGIDGGNTRGIKMWTAGDANWGIYMGQSGANKSFSNGTAVAGAGFSAHALRFRVANSSTQGFIFENASEGLLTSIRGSDGQTYFSGNVGIGATTPNAKLHVVAPAATTSFAARFTQTNTTNNNNMFIGLGTENAGWSKGAIGFRRTNSYDVGDMTFNLNSNAASGTDVSTADEKMRIQSTGEIFGKFRLITVHDYYQNSYYSGNRWMWFPKPGSMDQNESVDNRTQYGNIWLVPYSGKIVSITISTDNSSSNGGYEISNGRFLFAHHPDLNEKGGCSSGSNFCPVSTADAGQPGQFYVLSGNAAVDNGAGYFSINETPAGVVQWRAEGSNIFQFNKGDKVAIGINPDYIEDDNTYQITVVWEFDIWE